MLLHYPAAVDVDAAAVAAESVASAFAFSGGVAVAVADATGVYRHIGCFQRHPLAPQEFKMMPMTGVAMDKNSCIPIPEMVRLLEFFVAESVY